MRRLVCLALAAVLTCLVAGVSAAAAIMAALASAHDVAIWAALAAITIAAGIAGAASCLMAMTPKGEL